MALPYARNGRECENVWNTGRVLWNATLRVIVTRKRIARLMKSGVFREVEPRTVRS